MLVEIKIPSPGESISEVEIGKWLVENGAFVRKDQEIAEVESDKATLSLIATDSGKLNILAKEGDRVAVGSVACTIDTESAPSQETEKPVVEIIIKKEPAKEINIQEDSIKIVASESANSQKTPEITLKMTPTAKAVMEQANLRRR